MNLVAFGARVASLGWASSPHLDPWNWAEVWQDGLLFPQLSAQQLKMTSSWLQVSNLMNNWGLSGRMTARLGLGGKPLAQFTPDHCFMSYTWSQVCMKILLSNLSHLTSLCSLFFIAVKKWGTATEYKGWFHCLFFHSCFSTESFSDFPPSTCNRYSRPFDLPYIK